MQHFDPQSYHNTHIKNKITYIITVQVHLNILLNTYNIRYFKYLNIQYLNIQVSKYTSIPNTLNNKNHIYRVA